MSSPASHRRQRSSRSGASSNPSSTPRRRSTRDARSSAAAGTPSARRDNDNNNDDEHDDPAAQLRQEDEAAQSSTSSAVAPSSSPLRYRSSSPAPVDGSSAGAAAAARSSRQVSSPLGRMSESQSQNQSQSQSERMDVEENEGNRTPRASLMNGQGGGAGIGDSSPLRYIPSSSPGRQTAGNVLPSDSSGLFMRSGRSMGPGSAINDPRRGDINSDNPNTPRPRRRLFIDDNGHVTREDRIASDAPTFSNLDPNTSEAEAAGGKPNQFVWGTNIDMHKAHASMLDFHRNFTKKYRMWLDGASDDEVAATPDAESKECMEMMRTMLQLGTTCFYLDLRNLKAYPPTRKLHQQFIDYPSEMIPVCDQSIKDLMFEVAEAEMASQRTSQRSTQPAQSRDRTTSSEPPVPSSDRAGPEEAPEPSQDAGLIDLVAEVSNKTYRVRPFGMEQSVNMRELDPSDVDKIVSIKGLVIRTSPVIPDMLEAFFKCNVCSHTVKVDIDRGRIAEPTACPREVCKAPNSMQIIHNRSTFKDKQIIKLQETPDSVPAGQTPHSVSMCAYDDLVDLCKAGDRVEITGIFKASAMRVNPRQRTLKSTFKTFVDILHVQKVDKKRMGIDVSTVDQELAEQAAEQQQEVRRVTEQEEAKIKATAARPDIYDLLSRSLAPSIFEMDDVKKGILLQLFGGTNKSFEKGGSPKYRGDINVLLCGDPSTSKSQILKYVHRIAPRGVYTSGKGSSAVGLTAYVTRDPESRQLVLESGALVLSDGGVCCIDEFDKMSDATRSVLHEVMEQQTVSIAKAGIITTLNARTSILASANPIGSKYNPNLPVPQNIDLPPTLLSRFDLVYLILDRQDEANDRRLARHLLSMYLDDKPESATGGQEILPIEFLTSYISYARTKCQPRITTAAASELVDSYVAMRKLGEDVRAAERRITATTRQLESMVRLSEAHAKMRLSDEVTRDDVREAVRLIQSALKQAATDARTGLIDMSLLTEGTSAGERRRKKDLKAAVLRLLDDLTRAGNAVRYADVARRLTEMISETSGGSGGGGFGGGGASDALEPGDFAEAVRGLELEGSVLVMGEGARKMLRRVTGGGGGGGGGGAV